MAHIIYYKYNIRLDPVHSSQWLKLATVMPITDIILPVLYQPVLLPIVGTIACHYHGMVKFAAGASGRIIDTTRIKLQGEEQSCQ